MKDDQDLESGGGDWPLRAVIGIPFVAIVLSESCDRACPSASTPTARHAIYLDIWQRLQRLTDAARQPALAQIRAWDAEGDPAGPPPVTLTVAELRALADADLITIGGHTVTHPDLSTLSEGAQRGEIGRCKLDLEHILRSPVVDFSYPFGAVGSAGADTSALACAAGFVRACTTRPGTVTQLTEAMMLPRMHVGNWDGVEFSRRLADWLTA